MCYATGKVTECSYKHPNKIRNAGDKAKLFSANDESGFLTEADFRTKSRRFPLAMIFHRKCTMLYGG